MELNEEKLGKTKKILHKFLIKEIATFNSQNIGKYFLYSEIEYIDTSSVEQGSLTKIQKLKLKDAPSRAKRLIRGTVFGAVTKNDINDFKIIIPPQSLINQFNRVVSSPYNKIWNYNFLIRTLIKIHESVLPKLISGEIKV